MRHCVMRFVCGFVRRNHENLAAMGVEALRRILGEIGTDALPKELEYCLEGLRNALAETRPSLDPLLASLEDESVSDTSAGGVVGARATLRLIAAISTPHVPCAAHMPLVLPSTPVASAARLPAGKRGGLQEPPAVPQRPEKEEDGDHVRMRLQGSRIQEAVQRLRT